MRINSHVHVFNLRQLLTPRTRQVVRERLERDLAASLPGEALPRVAAELLIEVGEAAQDFNEERLLRLVLERLAGVPDVAELLAAVDVEEVPDEIRPLLAGGLDRLALRALRRGVTWLFGRLRSEPLADHRRTDLYDVLETLRIAASRDSAAVTAKLLAELEPDVAIVPLLMDITAGADEDTPVYRDQLLQAATTIFAYPGRFLPFVAVNPLRTGTLELDGRALRGHVELMRHALETMGFVGVKLYPSLGHRVDTPEMRPVYAYCEERGVPLVMHCNSGGFYVSEAARSFPDPADWEPILRDHPRLRVSFAHFGGGGEISGEGLVAGSWAARIVDLMARYEGVYADISFHRNPMESDAVAARYRANVAALLATPQVGDRLLFGTDFWLIRPRLSEANHWRFFADLLGEEAFRRISERNPRRFLGLPTAERPAIDNRALADHAARLLAQRARLLAMPAEWVLATLPAAERAAVENSLAGLLPSPRLPLRGFRDRLGGLLGPVASDVDLAFTADAAGSFAPFGDATLALEAAAALSVRSFHDPTGHDADGVLLPRPATSQPDAAPALTFEPGAAWLRYRLEGRLRAGLAGDVGALGLGIDASRTLVFADYRRHRRDTALATAISGDLARPRFALSRPDVLRLGENEALSLQVRSQLAAQVTLSWRDVLTAGLGSLAGLAPAGIPLALRVDLGASVSGRLEVTDDFQVVFARRGGRFRIVLRKLDSRGRTLTAKLGGAVQLDDPAAVAGLVDQLLARRLGSDPTTVERLAAAADPKQLSDAQRLLLREAAERLGVGDPAALAAALADARRKLHDRVLELASRRLEVGFAYEYARLESGATVLEATIDERTLEELHHDLVQGDLAELLDRARRGDPAIHLTEYLRQDVVVRRRAWGFHLGSLGGRDLREGRFVVQRGLDDDRLRIAFAGLRSYDSRWIGGERRHWQADLRAEMPDLLPVARLALAGFRYELGLLLEWRRERLDLATLREGLDAAVLWGVLPDDPETVASEEERLRVAGVVGKPSRLELQLLFDDRTLAGLLPAATGLGPAELASALAAAMPWQKDGARDRPSTRRRYYTAPFLALLQRQGDFDFRGVVGGLARQTADAMRRDGLATGGMEWDDGGRYRDRLWTFGGMVTLSPFADRLRRFELGLAALAAAAGDGTVRSADEVQDRIRRLFGDLQAFWQQTHHVRTAGLLLATAARAAGSAPRATLAVTWTHGGREEALVLGAVEPEPGA